MGAGAAKAVGNLFGSIEKGLKNIGGNIKSMTSSSKSPIKTGAKVGGGVALTGAGAGAGLFIAGKGAESAVNSVANSNPLNGIIKLFNPDATNEQARGGGAIIGIALVVGLVLLAVFVIIPQFNKSKGGK